MSELPTLAAGCGRMSQRTHFWEWMGRMKGWMEGRDGGKEARGGDMRRGWEELKITYWSSFNMNIVEQRRRNAAAIRDSIKHPKCPVGILQVIYHRHYICWGTHTFTHTHLTHTDPSVAYLHCIKTQRETLMRMHKLFVCMGTHTHTHTHTQS